MADTGVRVVLPRFTINYACNTLIYKMELREKAALLSVSQCTSAKIDLLEGPINTAWAFLFYFELLPLFDFLAFQLFVWVFFQMEVVIQSWLP